MPSNEVERMETARKKRRCLELRLESKSYRTIADEVGVCVETARTWIKEGIVQYLPEEELDDLRRMEASKIDLDEEHAQTCIRMLLVQADRRQAEDKNIDGEIEGIRRWKDTLLNLRKQRAMLLGLNKPVQINHFHKVRDTFDEEIEDLVTQLLGGGAILSDPSQVSLDGEQ